MNIGIILLVSVATGVVGYMARSYLGKIRLRSSEAQAQRIIQDAKREAEAKRKELLLEAKDQLLQEKNLLEKEMRERRQEIANIEKRYMQKEENLDAKVNQVEKREKEIEIRESDVTEKEAELTKEFERYLKELERISGLTQDQAKAQLIKSLEDNARFEALKIVNKIEEEARRSADKKAKDIVIQSIQRNVTEFTSENTVTAVTLPSDDMKGRIIGREGRNIRTLESLTGVDMIIDDTPEVVVISGYDPVRREIARLALERLIQNGRIHPARIEEVVEKVKLELEESMVDEGEKYAFELGIPGLSRDALLHVGKLKYRTSYGQNVLSHSIEVANIAAIMAGELKLDVQVAKRAGLLHDIGKVAVVEGEGSHALIGADMAKKYGESEKVVNIIASHHNDKEPESFEALIIQVADAISASRPGARRESLENYVKRLEDLENIATSFKGVEKCFAIQAGREIRVLVSNDLVSDERAQILAREVAGRIENELKYPGIVRVTVIRETRAVEFAK
jgi:ribonuclease Y